MCGVELRLEKEGGRCAYRGPSGASIVLSGCSVEVEPRPPVYYPERVSKYVMLVFDRPILLEPKAELVACVGIGVDFVVKAGGLDVEVFTTALPAKYALYGPPSRGVIARYVRARVLGLDDCSGVGGECYATLRVVMVNKSQASALVRRVVYIASGQSIGYCGEGCSLCGDDVVVEVVSPGVARVSVGEKSTLLSTQRTFYMYHGL